MEKKEAIIQFCLSKGIFFPSNEIYGGKAGFYDIGPIGKRIKNKLENLWRKMFIYEEGAFEIETTIVTPEIVLKASGHVDHFTDPAVKCKNCGRIFRADHLFGVEDREELEKKAKQERCPVCGGEFSNIFDFNLMFKTAIGGEGSTAYLRPETAQGIYTAFRRIYRMNQKLPLAIGQIGKSFRNEISPRKGLIRLREFTQMELEYFYNPEKEKMPKLEKFLSYEIRFLSRDEQEEGKTWGEKRKIEELVKKGYSEIMLYFLVKEDIYYRKIGFPDVYQFRELRKDETPHYSAGNVDVEVKTSFGTIEIAGNASRTDYDLSRHQEFSGENLKVRDEGKEFIPYIFEVSMGVERTLFALIDNAYREDDGRGWKYLALTPFSAPYSLAIIPYSKDVHSLQFFDDALILPKGSIRDRIKKAESLGIPYIAILDDCGVVLRNRDKNWSERLSREEFDEWVKTCCR